MLLLLKGNKFIYTLYITIDNLFNLAIIYIIVAYIQFGKQHRCYFVYQRFVVFGTNLNIIIGKSIHISIMLIALPQCISYGTFVLLVKFQLNISSIYDKSFEDIILGTFSIIIILSMYIVFHYIFFIQNIVFLLFLNYH